MRIDEYIFPEIGCDYERVNFSKNGKPAYIYLSIAEDCFWERRLISIPTELMDLVDISVAVYIADRFTFETGDNRYSISIVMPLRNPTFFANQNILDTLVRILYTNTGIVWNFQFIQR